MLIFLIASFATLLNAEDLSYPCEVIIPRSITGFFNTEIQVNTTYLPSGDVFIEKLTGNGDLFTLGKMPGINFIKFTLLFNATGLFSIQITCGKNITSYSIAINKPLVYIHSYSSVTII